MSNCCSNRIDREKERGKKHKFTSPFSPYLKAEIYWASGKREHFCKKGFSFSFTLLLPFPGEKKRGGGGEKLCQFWPPLFLAFPSWHVRIEARKGREIKAIQSAQSLNRRFSKTIDQRLWWNDNVLGTYNSMWQEWRCISLEKHEIIYFACFHQLPHAAKEAPPPFLGAASAKGGLAESHQSGKEREGGGSGCLLEEMLSFHPPLVADRESSIASSASSYKNAFAIEKQNVNKSQFKGNCKMCVTFFLFPKRHFQLLSFLLLLLLLLLFLSPGFCGRHLALLPPPKPRRRGEENSYSEWAACGSGGGGGGSHGGGGGGGALARQKERDREMGGKKIRIRVIRNRAWRSWRWWWQLRLPQSAKGSWITLGSKQCETRNKNRSESDFFCETEREGFFWGVRCRNCRPVLQEKSSSRVEKFGGEW